MAGESISIPILTPGADAAARNIKQVGNASAETAAKLDVAAASLELWNTTALKSAKADSTLIASKKAHAKADALLADAENVLAGRATKTTKLMADQGRVLEDAAATAGKAASGFSGLAGTGGIAGGGLGALIGAGVALAPVLVTVGTGLAGLAAAAYGVAKPIENAAQATGGLQANLGKLNPEQQQVAVGLLSLGKEFAAFQKALQPEVLTIFDQGLKLAAGLLRDVQPVAAATGKALGSSLAQIGAVFASGEWQQFFAFMQRTAGPDLQLLTANFTDLLRALPPLVQQLQPVAVSLLSITDALAKLTGLAARTNQALDSNGQHMNFLEHVTSTLRTVLFAPGQGLLTALKLLHITGSDAGKGLSDTAAGAAKAKTPVFDLSQAVATLNTNMTTLVGNLLSLQGDNLGWRQSMQAATAQLRSNSAGLEGNTKNALANKQAVLASTQAAIQFASQQLTLGRDIGGASRTVEAQIRFLQGLHDKSAFVRSELAALRKEEQLLEAQRIDQQVRVTGKGTWSVVGVGPFAGKPTGFATGGRVPGAGSRDTVPAMLTPGEAVVPRRLVGAVAPFLKANKVPGFAAGGIVPGYSGQVAGLSPWIRHNDSATIHLIDQAVANATLTAVRAAVRAASQGAPGVPGPGGGAPAANAALARRMMPAWGSGAEWAAWNYVAMRESGWNQFARNPSSGAYGIPQALPPSKMGAAANPPQSNPAAQISWMIGYIRGRYRDPIGAAAHERAFNWYDRGGFLPTGLSLAYNGTGRPEMVLPPGRSAQKVVLEVAPGGSGEFEQFMLTAIRRWVRIRGGNVQSALGR
jgi:hypothetical protein